MINHFRYLIRGLYSNNSLLILCITMADETVRVLQHYKNNTSHLGITISVVHIALAKQRQDVKQNSLYFISSFVYIYSNSTG